MSRMSRRLPWSPCLWRCVGTATNRGVHASAEVFPASSGAVAIHRAGGAAPGCEHEPECNCTIPGEHARAWSRWIPSGGAEEERQ
jgi:hypothetical protein